MEEIVADRNSPFACRARAIRDTTPNITQALAWLKAFQESTNYEKITEEYNKARPMKVTVNYVLEQAEGIGEFLRSLDEHHTVFHTLLNQKARLALNLLILSGAGFTLEEILAGQNKNFKYVRNISLKSVAALREVLQAGLGRSEKTPNSF